MINISDDIDKIENELYKKVFILAKEQYDEGKPIRSQYFLNAPDATISSLAIDMMMSPYSLSDWNQEA